VASAKHVVREERDQQPKRSSRQCAENSAGDGTPRFWQNGHARRGQEGDDRSVSDFTDPRFLQAFEQRGVQLGASRYLALKSLALERLLRVRIDDAVALEKGLKPIFRFTKRSFDIGCALLDEMSLGGRL
jgi:hypothetical protein